MNKTNPCGALEKKHQFHYSYLFESKVTNHSVGEFEEHRKRQ